MTSSILDKYFDEQTMSVHIQQGQPVVAKKGFPGERQLTEIAPNISKSELQDLVSTLHTEEQSRDDAYLEIQRSHSTVYQIGPYRVVIVHPPVADSIELTIVRQIKQLELQSYELGEEVEKYLLHEAKGILICGAPGQGKSTFAQAFITRLAEQQVIIKTLESPRDLIVPETVTQYSFTHASHSELRDILLLSRPDYTVYDEVRNKEDFHLYKDLRLTGIGLIGVMHATQAIDSVQRFLSVVDMGSIPQVIDTIIFIQHGQIQSLLTLHQTVKTPIGMESEDLARPVIQVMELSSQDILYEIYSYGDSIVVMPCHKAMEAAATSNDGIARYAKQTIEHELKMLLKCPLQVDIQGMKSINLYVPDDEKGRVIGKKGQRIEELEKMMGLSINVKTYDQLHEGGSDLPYEIHEVTKGRKRYIEIQLPSDYGDQDIPIRIGGHQYTFTTTPYGVIHIKKKKLVDDILSGNFSL